MERESPERPRIDLRSDAEVERIMDWLGQRLGYGRSRTVRWALWQAAHTGCMPDLPSLDRVLDVRPGRKPRARRPAPEDT